MWAMFLGAAAFNQPLPSFDTAKVTSVSAYLCRDQLDEKPGSDFRFLPNLLSDVRHVLRCQGLQPTTAIIRYCQGWGCEYIFVPSPT